MAVMISVPDSEKLSFIGDWGVFWKPWVETWGTGGRSVHCHDHTRQPLSSIELFMKSMAAAFPGGSISVGPSPE